MIPLRELVRFWAVVAGYVVVSGLLWTVLILLVVWVAR